MEPERAVFLVVAFATHGIVGFALVRTFTDANPALGFVLAIVPDVDFVLAAVWANLFVHRGVTHTPVFVLAATAVVYVLTRRRTRVLAAGLPLVSHLVIDSLSPAGVAWLYPVGGRLALGVDIHGPAATLLLLTASLAVVRWGDRGRRLDRSPSDGSVQSDDVG